MPLPGRTWEDQGRSGSSIDPLSLSPRGRTHNPLVRVVRLLVEDHVNRLIAFVTKLTFGLETCLRDRILLSGCSEVILKSLEGPGSTILQLKTYILPMTPCVQWRITPSNLYGVVGALWAAWIILSVQAVHWNHKSDEHAPTVTSWHKSSICQRVVQSLYSRTMMPHKCPRLETHSDMGCL